MSLGEENVPRCHEQGLGYMNIFTKANSGDGSAGADGRWLIHSAANIAGFPKLRNFVLF